MKAEQKKRILAVFSEVKTPGSKLRRKVLRDLRSGSVLIGKTKRNNPGTPESELEDAISEIYIFLCRHPWPWTMYWSTNDQTYQDEETANIVVLKLAALHVLTNRRIRDNRKAIEPSLHHHMLVEGSAPIRLRGDGDEGDEMEYQDTFTQKDRLDIYCTKLVPSNPQRMSLADYRAVSPIKAKCHTTEGHYSLGWCRRCYEWLRKKHGGGKVPGYSPSISLVRTERPPSKKRLSRLLGKVARSRGAEVTEREEVLVCTYDGLGFWDPTYTAEWFKTLKQTTPLNGNGYSHANLIRDLNRLRQIGNLALWLSLVTKHNQKFLGGSNGQ
jgi:hypothetical protein